MHRSMDGERSAYRINDLENTPQEEKEEKVHLKLCSGSCHAEEILQTLNAYRQSGILTDVVLSVGGQEFPCHRAALSANSAYFRAMFSSNLKEGRQNVISIQKIAAPAMSLLLDYMYGGNLVIQEDNVESVMEASDLLQIPRLRDACIRFLEDQLHPCNCVGILKFADSFSITSLSEKSKKFMLEGFSEVSCHEEFLDLSHAELIEYLSNEELVVMKEEVVYEAVMRWVRHDAKTRKKVLRDILEHVRLPLLDPTYFLEKVEMEAIIQDSPECFPLLHEARKYYILGNELDSKRARPRKFMDLAEVIVVIGGCDKKGLLKLPFTDRYHPKTKEWTALASVPGYTKSEFAACTLKNDIYVSGGHINSRDVWMFSSQLKVWIKIASLHKGRWRHKLVNLHGKLYAVGGFDGFHRLSTVECYDTFSNSWTLVDAMLEAVSSAAVTPCMNKLYVIGGAMDDYANTDKGLIYISADGILRHKRDGYPIRCITISIGINGIIIVQCYDPEEGKWTLVSSTPFCQRCINAVTLNNTIYVIGGLLMNIFSYNPCQNIWMEVASLPGPLESSGVTVCGGKIYILGGRDENGEGTDTAFTFNPAVGKLEDEPPLQRCISYHGCVTILQGAGR